MANPNYSYEAPERTGFTPITWGVQKITVTAVEVKETAKGTGYNVSAEIENEAGGKANFVSLGWFKKIDGDVAEFHRATAYVREKATELKRVYLLDRNSAEFAAADKAFKAKYSLDADKAYKYAGLAQQMDELVAFVSSFASYDAIKGLTPDSQKSHIEGLTGLLVGKTAFALIMIDQYEKEGKVRDSVNLTQNFVGMRAWPVSQVASAKVNRKSDGSITDCTITFSNGKTSTIKATAKNLKVTAATQPNDTENQYNAPEAYSANTEFIVPDLEGSDDLPF